MSTELTPHQKINMRAFAAHRGYKQVGGNNFKNLTKHLQSRKLACEFFDYGFCGTLRPARIASGALLFNIWRR